MVFAVICAGGIGSRMGNAEKPKQYLNVGGKPIILHTVEKFVVNENFEKVIVTTNLQLNLKRLKYWQGELTGTQPL